MGVAGEQLPPGKAEDITIASPLKGGGRNRFKVKIKNTKPMIIQNCCVIKKIHTSGTVKLWESPTRGGVYLLKIINDTLAHLFEDSSRQFITTGMPSNDESAAQDSELGKGTVNTVINLERQYLVTCAVAIPLSNCSHISSSCRRINCFPDLYCPYPTSRPFVQSPPAA